MKEELKEFLQNHRELQWSLDCEEILMIAIDEFFSVQPERLNPETSNEDAIV